MATATNVGHNGRVASREACFRRHSRTLLLSLLLVVISSCFSTSSPTSYAKPPAIAKAYFTAISVHHWADAAVLLMPSMRAAFLHGPYSAAVNIASISHIQVTPGGSDHIDETGVYRRLYLPYTDLWELSVDYVPVYIPNSFEAEMHPGTGNDVRTQFITLGRKDGAGPWQIILISSGP